MRILFVSVFCISVASAGVTHSQSNTKPDLRPAPIKPSTNTLQDNMPRVERGKLIDPLKPKDVKPPPNIIDKAVKTYQDAPVRPGVNTQTKTPEIQYQKKF